MQKGVAFVQSFLDKVEFERDGQEIVDERSSGCLSDVLRGFPGYCTPS